LKKQFFFRLHESGLWTVCFVPTRMAWTDRKVAVRIPARSARNIPARSARDIPVAGRFALPSMPSAFQL